MFIICPDAFYSQTQNEVIYLAILYHSILKLVFSCTSFSYPLDTYERDLVVYNYVCTKSQFTVCWEVKIHWHCVYTNLMCVEKSEFTVQLCVHKLTSVKLDQTHTELITGGPYYEYCSRSAD